MLIPTLIAFQPKSTFLYQDTELLPVSTSSDVNQVIWPSLAIPTTITNGSKLDIRFRSDNSMEPVEVRMFNDFLEYTKPVLNTNNTGILNEKVSTVNLPTNIEPFLYSFELIYSNGDRIESLNSLLVRRSDYREKDQSYSFIQITDIHVDGSEQRYQQIIQLFTEINLIKPNFLILTGDFVDGLTTDKNGEMVTAAVQYPQGIELLKILNIPALVINGNHDFQTNQWQDGNFLWEENLGPIENLVEFSFNNDTFIGTNLFDENGLSANQLTKIDEAFENSTNLRIFFAHTDYKNQFPALYTRNSIDLSLLGHAHSSSENTISDTTEIITDNSVTLIDTEPGHYRLFTISESKEITIQEIEVDKLYSNVVWESVNETSLMINISLKNYHNFPFERVTETVVFPDNWSENSISDAVDNWMHFNGSHTKLTTQFYLDGFTESNYSLSLTSPPSVCTWIHSSTPLNIVYNPTGISESSDSTSTKAKAGISLLDMIGVVLSTFVTIRIFKRK
jgi:hypothetical protein